MHHLRAFAFALAAGFFATLLIAWSCAAWSPRISSVREVGPGERELVLRAGEALGTPFVGLEHGRGFDSVLIDLADPTWHERFEFWDTGPGALPEAAVHPAEVMLVRAGWPFRAFEGASWWHPAGTLAEAPDDLEGWSERNRLVDVVPVETNRVHDVLLPYRPRWPGLLGNTAIFGGILWVLLAVPSSLHGVYRRRRGLCETCNYLKGPDGCPECGRGRDGDAGS